MSFSTLGYIRPTITADYIIEKKDSVYYAKDSKGEIKYSDDDATTVIQWVINQLTSGGKIYFTPATYLLSATINLTGSATKRISLVGTKSAVLKAKDGAGLDAVIKITDSHKENLIEGLTIDGNKANSGASRGIWIVSPNGVTTTWVDVKGNSIINCPTGIDIETQSGGGTCEHHLIANNMFGVNVNPNDIDIRIYNSKMVRIIGNILEDTDDIGILVDDHSYKIDILGNHFDDQVNYGIKLDGYSASIIIAHNLFEDVVNYDSIYIPSTCADNIISGNVWNSHPPKRHAIFVEGQRNVIIGNTMFDLDNDNVIQINGARNIIVGNTVISSAYDGIEVNGDLCVVSHNLLRDDGVGLDINSVDNIIINNILDANTVNADIVSGSIVKHNKGYVTENSGVATFSGDGTTTVFKISHGLVSTPSKYAPTPLTPDADASRTVTVDDTYIIITYDTAPPSGTDNLKFGWWAKI